ncbi:MAG: hypothetical protein V1720_00430 [bacterium]
MNTKKNNIFRVSLFILLIVFGAALVTLNAQDKKVKEKIKSIEGDAKTITIVTDEGTYTFESDDAGVLLGYIKDSGDDKSFNIYLNDEDNDKDNRVFVFKSDGDDKDEKNFVIKKLDKDFKWEGDNEGDCIKIILNEENGEKKLTVTTKKEGKEEVKVYEGKEAEEYLEKNEPGCKMMFLESYCSGSEAMVWNVATDDTKKIVEVEVKDGAKKVTITTTEDGKEKKEIFEGEEAEKQIEKLKKESKIDICDDHMIYIQSDDNCKDSDETILIKLKDGDCKKMKKIIIEKEEKKDKK